jgi:hypothetical protein
MKKRGKWQSLVGLLGPALFIYFIFFLEEELKTQVFEQLKQYGPIIIFGVIVLSSIYGFYSRRKRKEDLKEFGTGMGFFSSPKGDYPAFLKKIKWSGLFGGSGLVKASPRNVRYLMQGNIDSAEVAIFDRVIISGGGEGGGSEELTTVVLFESTQLSLPYFLLRPEGILGKMGSAFGDPDIDFEEFPKFSRQYLLRGTEEQVRIVFNSNVLSYFDNDPGWTLEGFETQLLVYRNKESAASKEEFQEFVQQARMIFQLFQ